MISNSFFTGFKLGVSKVWHDNSVFDPSYEFSVLIFISEKEFHSGVYINVTEIQIETHHSCDIPLYRQLPKNHLYVQHFVCMKFAKINLHNLNEFLVSSVLWESIFHSKIILSRSSTYYCVDISIPFLILAALLLFSYHFALWRK